MTAPASSASVPGVAAWLGLLLVLVITLNSLGGWVRLSGSGVAIPAWPAIPLGEGRWTLWPPVSDAGWQAVQAAYAADQQRLAERVAAGELRPANLGRVPRDPGEFRAMFLTEWSHRLLAALVGIVTAVCLVRILRDRDLRRRVGVPMGAAAGLIGLQAVLGGMLVTEGTSTNWLFLHQGNAGAIVACLALACLRLVAPGVAPPTAAEALRRRPALAVGIAAIVLTWVQMVLGALVAGSRHGAPFPSDFPTMFGMWVPPLWDAGRDLVGNLLDGALLHHFVHRWLAWLTAAAVLAAWWLAARRGAGERARLGFAVAATFLGCEMIIGIGNVVLAAGDGSPLPALALAHQVGATCLLIALVLGCFWLRNEAASEAAPAAADSAAPVAAALQPAAALAAAPAADPPRGAARAVRYALDLLVLMKWRITATALFTGYVALVVEGGHHADWRVAVPVLLAMTLTGGAANTLNQIFERDRDEVMKRTRNRRPLPSGRISVRAAWIFAGAQFAAAQWLYLAVLDSPLAAALGGVLVAYYSFFYTLWLKPRHWLNIVIGGVPGAMGPPLAWAAATGGLDWAPIGMFLLIFLWTPPHVWALAIKLKDDYARVGIPMLPVVKGVDETSRQIVIYTASLVAGSLLLPLAVPATLESPIYLVIAGGMGVAFLAWAVVVWRRRPMPATMPLFHFSNVYIFALFIALMADAVRARAG